jgi:hypothetical protein
MRCCIIALGITTVYSVEHATAMSQNSIHPPRLPHQM